MAAIMTWDEESWDKILTRQQQACREAGWLAPLLITMNGLAVLTVWRGDFAAAASLDRGGGGDRGGDRNPITDSRMISRVAGILDLAGQAGADDVQGAQHRVDVADRLIGG